MPRINDNNLNNFSIYLITVLNIMCCVSATYATSVRWAHPMKKNDSFVHIFLIYTLWTGCDHSFHFRRRKKNWNFPSRIGHRQKWRVMGSCYYSSHFFFFFSFSLVFPFIHFHMMRCSVILRFSHTHAHTFASRETVIQCCNNNNNRICSMRAGV